MTSIFACIDGSATSVAICDAASWAADQTGQPITLLHVLERNEFAARGEDLSGSIGLGSREDLLVELAELDHQRSKLAQQQGKLQLKGATDLLARQGHEAATLQRHGSLLETVTELAPQTRLMIMGKRGEAHDGLHGMIGSHLESVIRTLANPILVVHPGFTAPTRYLFAYDASPTARAILTKLAGSDLLKGIPCHLVMVGDTDAARQSLAEAAAELESAGIRVTQALLQGEVVECIGRYVADQQIDLLIMGAYGHSRIRQFIIGSTTTELLKQSHVSVLLLR